MGSPSPARSAAIAVGASTATLRPVSTTAWTMQPMHLDLPVPAPPLRTEMGCCSAMTTPERCVASSCSYRRRQWCPERPNRSPPTQQVGTTGEPRLLVEGVEGVGECVLLLRRLGVGVEVLQRLTLYVGRLEVRQPRRCLARLEQGLHVLAHPLLREMVSRDAARQRPAHFLQQVIQDEPGAAGRVCRAAQRRLEVRPQPVGLVRRVVGLAEGRRVGGEQHGEGATPPASWRAT